MGGQTFAEKLGLRPRWWMIEALLLLGKARALVMAFMPLRLHPKRLSELLMRAHYAPLAAQQMDFSQVGPEQLLQRIKQRGE